VQTHAPLEVLELENGLATRQQQCVFTRLGREVGFWIEGAIGDKLCRPIAIAHLAVQNIHTARIKAEKYREAVCPGE